MKSNGVFLIDFFLLIMITMEIIYTPTKHAHFMYIIKHVNNLVLSSDF